MNKCKPRIVILHYSCSPVVGGVESVIAEHARLLVDNGYAVTVIAGEGEHSGVKPSVTVKRGFTACDNALE